MDYPRLRLGVSTCLLGEPVRYDGQHKLDRYVRDVLGQYADFVPVCPEVECGFPVPRPSFRLVGDPSRPRLVVGKTGEDVTERMEGWAETRLKQLEEEALSGFIFKRGSPSSGMERVKVYDEKGMPHPEGSGIFARMFMEHFPNLPVEEEGRLHDLNLRENFIERLFAMDRWQQFVASDASLGGLVRFHSQQKLLIMSHSLEHYKGMGRLVATAKTRDQQDVLRQYAKAFMDALSQHATRGKHANVLYHIMGYFKDVLDPGDKEELVDAIEEYRTGITTLVVPLTLLRHHARRHGSDYLLSQCYLQPHPYELQLRNHA